MGVNILFTVERRIGENLWERAEKLVPNDGWGVMLYEDDGFPEAYKAALIRENWDYGERGRWLGKIGEDICLERYVSDDISEETREYLAYWTDADFGWRWLTLRELENYDWRLVHDERYEIQIRDRFLPKLRAIGEPDDVRVVRLQRVIRRCLAFSPRSPAANQPDLKRYIRYASPLLLGAQKVCAQRLRRAQAQAVAQAEVIRTAPGVVKAGRFLCAHFKGHDFQHLSQCPEFLLNLAAGEFPRLTNLPSTSTS